MFPAGAPTIVTVFPDRGSPNWSVTVTVIKG